jgi:hypothetical protein
MFDYDGKYINESIRVPIIHGLSRYHPYDEMVNQRFYAIVGDLLVLINTGKQKEMVQQYVKDFNIWAQEKYGVTPEGVEPQPIFREIHR